MIEEQYQTQLAMQGKLGYGDLIRGIDHNPTVEENIEQKIRYHESELIRLKQSKEDLAPLLKMRIRDIRQAMEY
jgi:hypothetical protein